jgi:hypothetical protein
MTDPTPRPDDELVSAVLDGEASADERARVEADPASRQRLAELRAVRDLVAAPVPVPADAREAAIAAALGLFDAAATGPVGPAGTPGPSFAPPAPPTDQLAARRASRRGSGGGRFLAVAAAIVVVVIGAGVVLRMLNPPSNQTVATSADQSSEAPQVAAGGSGGPANAERESEPGGVVSTTTAPDASAVPTTTMPVPAEDNTELLANAVTVDLGAISGPADLRARLLGVIDTQVDQGTGAPPTTVPAQRPADTAALAPCASYLAAVDPELGELLAVGSATYAGQPALVYAFRVDQVRFPAANGSIRIYAVDPTCSTTFAALTVR